jgi:hypothetical protein
MIEFTDEPSEIDWNSVQDAGIIVRELEKSPSEPSSFLKMPAGASRPKNYDLWKRRYTSWLYQNKSLELLYSTSLKEKSLPDESERDFRIRLLQLTREKRDAESDKLRTRYDKKIASLQDKIFRAEQAVDREQEQLKQQKMQTGISFGATILSSFLGGRQSSVGRMTTAARGVGRSMKEKQDVARARASLSTLKQKRDQIETDFLQDMASIKEKFDIADEQLEKLNVRPLKKNISVPLLALGWFPYFKQKESGQMERAF